MNVVGYVRVSTQQQAAEGHGLDVQRDAITAWAHTNSHTLIAIHSDEGISGTTDAPDRPGLSDALAAIDSGIATILAVHRLDRLARTLTVQEAVLGVCWKSGGRVWSLDVGEVPRDDPDDPMRTAMRQMAGVFAQLDRSMTVAKLRAGRRKKAEGGGFAAFGSPAFGQRSEDTELVADLDEQDTVGRIVELRRGGRTLRQVAAALQAEGRPAKRSARWHPQTVARVLARAGLNAEGEAA